MGHDVDVWDPPSTMIRICFVCLGNICRSPTAEGIMRKLVREASLEHAIEVASAGTADYHVGEPADRRAQQTARERGVTLAGRAAHFRRPDFDRFDYVIAMDASNRADLLALTSNEDHRARVRLLRSFDPRSAGDAGVPDPYYGGADGFGEVFDICEAACQGLLTHIRTEHRL